MASIFDSIVTAVMEPAQAAAEANKAAPAPAPAAPAAPPAAARPAGEAPARPAPNVITPSAASVGAAVGAAVSRAAPAAAAPAPAAPAPATPAPAAPSKISSPAEVEQRIAAIAAARGGSYNWKQSIVDLMKLLNLDSSLGARKQLATELGYSGALDGSAEMNVWLHKRVMEKLGKGDY